MTEYDTHISQLTERIYGAKLMRDAQRPDSGRYDRFQREIDGLTDDLQEWTEAAPELAELDAAIGAAERRLVRTERASEDEQHLTGLAAKWLGGLGIICLLVSVTWMPSFWFPVLAVLCIAGAVGAVMTGTRGRRARAEAIDVAESDLSSLRARREHRVPAMPVTRSVARSIPAVGRLLVDAELEAADD